MFGTNSKETTKSINSALVVLCLFGAAQAIGFIYGAPTSLLALLGLFLFLYSEFFVAEKKLPLLGILFGSAFLIHNAGKEMFIISEIIFLGIGMLCLVLVLVRKKMDIVSVMNTMCLLACIVQLLRSS